MANKKKTIVMRGPRVIDPAVVRRTIARVNAILKPTSGKPN